MKSFVRKIFDGEVDEKVHEQFIRFGKGKYSRRFLLSFSKGKNIKIRGSFEWANDFVEFVKENKEVKFSGNILSRGKIEGVTGKKKSGSFVYEIVESSLEKFEDAYCYLLNVNDEDIVLKIKKKLPKPGKSEDKIDDKFCSLDLNLKYWENFKDSFFWDIPECKKASIEHEIEVDDIILPSGVKDPAEIRKLAKRKGNMKRKITFDGKDEVKAIGIEV
jgi:hypothetical protein